MPRSVGSSRTTDYEHQTEIVSQLKQSNARIVALELENKKFRASAKLDRLAHEGQVKRSRVFEHQITELKHNVMVEARLREEADKRNAIIDVALQRERALRLKDLHRLHTLEKASLDSEKARTEIEHNWMLETKHVNDLTANIREMKVKLGAQERIIMQNDDEFRSCVTEIGTLKVETIQLKKKLNECRKALAHHMNVRKTIEYECNRLRTDLTTSAKSNKDQARRTKLSKARHIPSLKLELISNQHMHRYAHKDHFLDDDSVDEKQKKGEKNIAPSNFLDTIMSKESESFKNIIETID